MTTKAKAKSRILEAAHETATDLHSLGFIDKRKQQKLEVLCSTPARPPCANGKSGKSTQAGHRSSC